MAVLSNLVLLLLSTTSTLSRSPEDAHKGCTSPFFLPNLPYFVVWNVPSYGCRRQGVDLNLTAYGIVDNFHDTFTGGNMTIFYNIGNWPHYNGPTHTPVNGGLPQEGDLHDHLMKETGIVKTTIPSEQFNGLSVIDFESWRPHLDWNFGTLRYYQTMSNNLVKKEHPTWNSTMIHTEAVRQFDSAARAFMQSTIQLAKQLRPLGHWGYYGYPRCWGVGKDNVCQAGTVAQNDKYLSWLFTLSTGLYPRIYTNRKSSLIGRHKAVRQIVNETLRVQVKWSGLYTPVMPYTLAQDSGTDFFMKEDLQIAIQEPADMGASGATVWGSSGLFHTPGECQKLRDDIKNVFGPFVKNLTEFTQACAATLCNSHGRCVSKEYEAQTQEFLRQNKKSSCFRSREEYENIPGRRREQFGKDLYSTVNKYDNYICRCLPGWHGEFCDQKFN